MKTEVEAAHERDTTPTLIGQNLSRAYESRNSRGLMKEDRIVAAVQNVFVEILPSRVTAVVGESGSGKSTLGRLLLGMEKPDSGSVLYCGHDINSNREIRKEFQRNVQVVFQDPTSSLNPRMRVDKILAEPLNVAGRITQAETAERISRVLKETGLPSGSESRYPHQFSGGQRQRIAIARAIIVEPQFIIMDEPVSSLDVSAAAQVLSLIEALRDDLGLGLLLITHNLAHAWRLGHSVAIMQHGTMVETGAVREVFRRPQHAYTRRLLDAIPQPIRGTSRGTMMS